MAELSPIVRLESLPADDQEYIRMVYALRERLEKPTHSHFRVCAVIVFRDRNGNIAHVVGSNLETCFIHGSICAERSAIPKMREHGFTKVEKLYLASDGGGFITPGILCREFLAELADLSLPIYLTGGETLGPDRSLVSCGVRIERLATLLPFAPLYRGIDRAAIHAYGRGKAEQAEAWRSSAAVASVPSLLPMLEATLAATAADNKDVLHSIRYAAGVLFSDGSFEVSHQTKALEYGGTLDPITKLCVFMERARAAGIAVTHVAMLDQFGLAHGPMARGRCYLHENGYGATRVLLHDPTTLRLVMPTARELLPQSPDIEELLGGSGGAEAMGGVTAVAKTIDLGNVSGGLHSGAAAAAVAGRGGGAAAAVAVAAGVSPASSSPALGGVPLWVLGAVVAAAATAFAFWRPRK